jgi:hypothetical protein
VYYFDLGSTLYNERVACETDRLKLQPERFRKYAYGTFNDVLCWDARPVPPEDYWTRVPVGIAKTIAFLQRPCAQAIGIVTICEIYASIQ